MPDINFADYRLKKAVIVSRWTTVSVRCWISYFSNYLLQTRRLQEVSKLFLTASR